MSFRVYREGEDGRNEFSEEVCDDGGEAAEVVVGEWGGVGDRSGDEEAVVKECSFEDEVDQSIEKVPDEKYSQLS